MGRDVGNEEPRNKQGCGMLGSTIKEPTKGQGMGNRRVETAAG
jgi:hypothetical protein